MPLVFENEADYDSISLNDELVIDKLHSQLENGKISILNKTTGKSFNVTIELSERQKGMILAGGLLNYTKNNG